MNLVQFILLIGILFYADTTNGQIANTTALDPFLHYINITIRYNNSMIRALYQDSMIILPEYGIVLASCYLNISGEEVNSTSYNTSDLVVVEITNFNISLFYRTYDVTQFMFSDEDDSVDTMVKFEFYLTQNGTFILATDAIDVFSRNCDTSNWKDSFTSDSLSASASFSSKQTSLLSSSLPSSSIYTSSFQYIPSISSVASVVSSHLFTTEPSQQVSAPVSTSPTLPSSVIEVNTTPLSVETTSVYSTYVQTQVNPSTASVASRTIPSMSQSAVRSSSNASTPTLTLNTSAVSTSMSLLVDSRVMVDLPSTGILRSSLSSPVQFQVTSSAFLPSSSIYSSQHIVQPTATSTRPLVLVSSRTQSIVSLQNSTAIIQQPSFSTSSIRQPLIPSSSISSAINFRLLSSSIVPLSTNFKGTQSFSSSAPIYQTTFLLSAVHSLTSAVSRMLTQTSILQAYSSVQAPFSNTSTASQFVVLTHSVPQQPSAVFITSQISSTISTSQLSSTHFLNTSTLIDRVTTQPHILPTATPIHSTVIPSASSIQPTSILPQVSPYRHYLIATIEYTLPSVEIGQTDDNINATITAIVSRYLNLTTQTAIAMYTLTTEHISVRIGNLTVTAIRSEYDQSQIENLATRRLVFYVTDNTAILLATQAMAVLDTYSIDQWAESTGLQISSVTFDLYGEIQSSSMIIATMTVSPQLSSSIPILNTTFISMTSLTTRPVLSTSSTELNLSLIVSSLQPVTSSSIRATKITTTRHSMLTSLFSQIQQSLPSSSVQTTPIVTRSISTPVKLMTSSLRDSLITLSSNRSAFQIPGSSTTESPVISMTSSLISVLNSTLLSQRLVSSIFPTTQAVQPSLTVTSSGISSVQQLRPNTTSLPAMVTVNSTQFPTSTRFPNSSVRIMTSSPIISRITTQTSIQNSLQNSSSSQIASLSSQMNTSSFFPTQRVSISQSLTPSPNSSLLQIQSVPPSSTPTPPHGDYQILTDFDPGVGYLLQLTLNALKTKVNLSREFYVSTELNLINLYSLGLEIAGQTVNNRRKRDVFNTTSQIACGIIESLTNAANNRLIIVFYISREENGLPLTFVRAETSKYIFDNLDPSNYTAALSYQFLSLSIYEGIFVDPHRLAIIVGTVLGCCSLIMLISLVVLCLYHCLHSNYIRADKWSSKMSVTYSNKGVYTGSTSKHMNENGFEMEFTRTNLSEGTQTLARDFLSGSSEITRTTADYAFTLRTKPNLFSPFPVEETLSPTTEATTRSADETETNKYPSPSEAGTVPTLSQLRTDIEEEKRRAKTAEASLLEIMTSNRKHLPEASVFSDASEARRAEERASAAYEKSKKELAMVTAAVTPSSSYDSSLGSSRGAHKPWSARGNKVAPSNEPFDGLTPEPKILDWVPEHQSVSSKSSKMHLSSYRNVRPPNIMQVEARPILETPPPTYDQSPVETVPKPIPVRVFRTDGHSVQMHPSVSSTPVTTSTINVLPSFNPFYTTAKKEHTSL